MPTLAELDAQIAALEEQKKQIKQRAKDAALKKANDAIEELRGMGFNYRLAELTGSTARGGIGSGGGSRRTGVRDQVLAAIKQNPNGITAADVLTILNATSGADKTSIRNALAALKRAGAADLKDGKYRAK